MYRILTLSLAACIAIGFLVHRTHAAPDGTSTGAITGTVMKDGKPVVGAKVRLAAPHEKKSKKGAAPTTNPSDSADKPAKVPPLATATTDADGKFVLSDVAAGDYVVNVTEKGMGKGKAKVSVAAGQSSDIAIDLQDAKPKDKTAKKNKLGL